MHTLLPAEACDHSSTHTHLVTPCHERKACHLFQHSHILVHAGSRRALACAVIECLVGVHDLPAFHGHIHKEVGLVVAVHRTLERPRDRLLPLEHRRRLQLARDKL